MNSPQLGKTAYCSSIRSRVRPCWSPVGPDLVSGEAVGPHDRARAGHIAAKQVEIEMVVAAIEKDLLTAIAAPRDVVRKPGHEHSSVGAAFSPICV